MTIGMSDFARNRHHKGTGFSYFDGTEVDLMFLVRMNWGDRCPGTGREDLSKVVCVNLPPERFVVGTTTVTDGLPLKAIVERRQPHEDPHVKVYALGGQPETAHFAKVVLYSAEALLENDGKRSGTYDWEIVAIIASTVEDEPMHPLTMARNFLEKSGGTKCEYTAQQFAEAIYYWSQRVTKS
jgi:hypothetical protein